MISSDTTDIGELAGDVWRYLERNGEASALKLRFDLDIPQGRLFLALGWLAREEKIRLLNNERGWRVSIKK